MYSRSCNRSGFRRSNSDGSSQSWLSFAPERLSDSRGSAIGEYPDLDGFASTSRQESDSRAGTCPLWPSHDSRLRNNSPGSDNARSRRSDHEADSAMGTSCPDKAGIRELKRSSDFASVRLGHSLAESAFPLRDTLHMCQRKTFCPAE